MSYPRIQFGYSGDSSSDDEDLNFSSFRISNRPCNETHITARNVSGNIGKKFFVECAGNDRSLDWEIDSFKPHKRSDPYKAENDLIGEIVYGRDGRPLPDGSAEFAFKAPEKLECHAGKCYPDTQHARLHKDMYGKCPEEEKGLVATGFSHQKSKGLVFNSTTLNDNRNPYLNSKFYKTEPTRTAGDQEKHLIRQCTDKWRNENCPTENWRYSIDKNKKQSQPKQKTSHPPKRK